MGSVIKLKLNFTTVQIYPLQIQYVYAAISGTVLLVCMYYRYSDTQLSLRPTVSTQR